MKKILAFICSIALCLGMSACSSKTAPSADIANDVAFELVDVLKVRNDSTNTTYYYYLANITNNSDEEYHMQDLSYDPGAMKGSEVSVLHPIDQYQSTITAVLQPEQSSSVYGYYGFPDGNDGNAGLEFSNGNFISFDSIKERTIQDANITNSDEANFIIYEDEYFEFEVNSEELAYNYKNGVSVVSGLVLTYKNKTAQRLVVPFLTPACTIDGVALSDYKDPNKLKKMNLSELEKFDFKTNGMAPKTKSYDGTALNYELYYLEPNQEVPCYVIFTFKGIVPDFTDSSKHNGITIQINSPSLGYSQTMKVPY